MFADVVASFWQEGLQTEGIGADNGKILLSFVSIGKLLCVLTISMEFSPL
jgi:hypothetical protein